MKFIVLVSLLFSLNALAGNLITNPTNTSDNSVSAPNGVKAMELNSTDSDAIDAYATSGAGGFFSSEDSYGAMGTSTNGTSGWFSSNASQNNSPTLVSQSIGLSNADLFQIQDELGSAMLKIDKDGALILNALGVSQPSCNSNHRGALWYIQGGTGVADQLQVCMKAAGGSYSWVTK